MLAVVADAQQLRQEAFELINLDYPGLEKVKTACSRQRWEEAAQELLAYYRNRTDIAHPDIDLRISPYPKKNRSGRMMPWITPFLYIKVISLLTTTEKTSTGNTGRWKTMNSVGNCTATNGSLRWGKAYRISGDEKYAKEWAHQYIDWIKKESVGKDGQKRIMSC